MQELGVVTKAPHKKGFIWEVLQVRDMQIRELTKAFLFLHVFRSWEDISPLFTHEDLSSYNLFLQEFWIDKNATVLLSKLNGSRNISLVFN